MSQKIICASIVMGSLLLNSGTIVSSKAQPHSSTVVLNKAQPHSSTIKKAVMPSKKPEFVLKVNGENISWEKYLSALEESPTVNEIFQSRKNATGFTTLEALVKETALIHLCKARGIQVTPAEIQKKYDEIKKSHPDFEKALKSSSVSENHMKHELMIQQYEYKFITYGIVVSEKDIADFYQKNIQEYTTPTKYKLRVILLADESKKEEIDKKIKEGTKFEDLAKEFSTHPSKNEGGSLPPCSKDQLPAELKTELEKLKINEVSEWVKLGDKSFMIKLDEMIPESKQPLDNKLKAEIKERLLVEKGSEKNNLNNAIYNYLSEKKIDCLYGKYIPRFNQFIESIKQKVKAEKEAKLRKAKEKAEAAKKPAVKVPEKTEVNASVAPETKTSENPEMNASVAPETKTSENTEVNTSAPQKSEEPKTDSSTVK